MDGQRIIIFGGRVGTNKTSLQPQDSLYELDLIDYKWYIPKISGKIPGSRYDHKANVIGKYMVISFGKYHMYFIIEFYMIVDFVVNKQPFKHNYLNSIGIGYNETENDLLLLDISNNDEYIWTTIFHPIPPTPPTSPTSPTPSTSPTSSTTNNTPTIIVVVIGSLIAIFLY